MKLKRDTVLIVGNSAVGFYKFRKELISILKEEGKKVVLCFPNGLFRKELEEMGCSFIATPINRRGLNLIEEFKLFWKYYRILKDVKPNAVFTYTIKPNIYVNLICRWLHIPSAANITGLGSAVEVKGLLQKFTLFLYRIALKKSKCIFFQNKENYLFFEKHGISSCRKELIPGSGVNLSDFIYQEFPSAHVTEFLFEGRVMREKGIEQFLDIAESIKPRYPQTQFTIIGTYEEQEWQPRIECLQQKNIVHFDGAQQDVRPYLKRCSCVIHPTYYPEGMSNVLLEAAASGRPVITTNRSGCREIVEDGRTGFFAHERNSQDFIQKVETFLQLSWEEKRKMGKLGREKVEREFDRQLVMERYRTVLKEMIG